MRPVSGPPAVAVPPSEAHIRLRRMAHELEAVFMAQLFQAMRASVHEDAETGDAGGRALYESLLDDHLASQAAGRSERGIGEALYRQLSRRITAGEPPATRS